MLALAVLVVLAAAAAARPPEARSATIYWGAYIKGDTFGFDDAPFDPRTVNAFESDAGKGVSIIHWGQPWVWTTRGGYQPFPRAAAESVRVHGAIPMITWTSNNQDAGNSISQPSFQLARITRGDHDAYIRQWADDAKAWGYPIFVRFDPEMNGDWYNWSEAVNGNADGQFVPMWRHVVDIFRQEGATNVTWVWAPNRTWLEAPISLAALYPGSSYVDWSGISGYNWGTNPAKANNEWQTFDEVFKDSYRALLHVAVGKPIMIAETASSDFGGSKAAWITDALGTQLPEDYPAVKAFVWFNWNARQGNGRMDWVIESSTSVTTAFRRGIDSSYYDGSSFSGLSPLHEVPLPPATNPAGGSGGGGTGGGGTTGGGGGGGSDGGGGTTGGGAAARARVVLPARQTLRSVLLHGLRVKVLANPRAKVVVRVRVGRSVVGSVTRRLGAGVHSLVIRVRFSAATRRRLATRPTVRFLVTANARRAVAVTVRRR